MKLKSNPRLHLKKPVLLAIAVCFSTFSTWAEPSKSTDPYKAEWNSLYAHEEAPEWFQDAKFGIYFHWGPYSVPAFGHEWYPRWMYYEGDKRGIYEHHKKTYGDVNSFGYHDFIPMFKAEKFDAKEWAEVFKQAGAKFAGPVAEHHDGFAMWDSDITPWNSMDMGPKKDIVGELAKEIRGQDMKFITTFHHCRNLSKPWRPDADPAEEPEPDRKFWDSHFPIVPGTDTTSDDPKMQLLYGNMDPGTWYEKIWKGKLIEVIDKYQPDIIWFDVWLDQIPDRQQMEFAAHYLNSAKKWDREVVIVTKHLDIPEEVSVEDFERGRLDKLSDRPWMSDDSIGMKSWSYVDGLQIKPTSQVLHSLIDIVSKNGVLLFNISPKADGTIPDDQRAVLLEMGDWLNRYGAAIYATRPWKVYGEGPTQFDTGRGGHFIKEVNYTPQDIRFTQSKDGKTVYAIALGWPGEGAQLKIASLGTAANRGPKIETLRLMGSEESLDWSVSGEALTVKMPKQAPAGSNLGIVLEATLSP